MDIKRFEETVNRLEDVANRQEVQIGKLEVQMPLVATLQPMVIEQGKAIARLEVRDQMRDKRTAGIATLCSLVFAAISSLLTKMFDHWHHG